MHAPLTTAAPDRPGRRLLVPAIVLAAFGLNLANLAPPTATLAIRIAAVDPAGKTAALSGVVATGAVLTIAGLPLFGAFSDRTRGRFGRRRPWLVAGAATGLAGLALAGAAGSAGGVAAGYGLASLGHAAAFAGFLPLIPEFVPERRRARVSALIGFVTALAVLAGAWLGSALSGAPVLMLALPGAVATAAALALAAVLGDADRPRQAPPRSRGDVPLRDRDFTWNWVSRLLLGIAYVGVQTYAVYYLTDSAGLSTASAADAYARLNSVATPLSIACFLLAGYLSDRWRRRRSFAVAGAALLAAGVLTAGGYPVFFGVLAAMALLAAVCVRFVREVR